MMDEYVPSQGDIVWLDFDPASGREIKKRRPALVISRSQFNSATNFAVVCPITSTFKDLPTRVSLPSELQIKGQIIVSQLKSLGFRSRQMIFVERVPEVILQYVLQVVNYIF